MLDKLLQGRYKLIEILGTGGFGDTYLAQDTSQPNFTNCVVKHLKQGNNYFNSLPNVRQLLTREAEALKKLSNYDRVPQLLDYFEEDEEFYLVQEFIAGYPLSDELQSDRWSENQVIELLQQILSILDVVHSHGLIHRDIKPSNLIRRKQDNQLVLVDFGAVKQAWTQVITQAGKTSTNFALGVPATIAIGTPGYMPSEQERGRPRPNSDIYAVGMIAIQALTGLNPTQLLDDLDTGEIIWLDHAQVSDQLACILNKMVRYHFKERYQSAKEVLQALQQLVMLSTPTVQALVTASAKPQAKIKLPTETIPVFQREQSQLLLANKPKEIATVAISRKTPTLLIGISLGIASVLAFIAGIYYFVGSGETRSDLSATSSSNTKIPQSPAQVKNSFFVNFALTKTLTGHSDSVWAIAVSPNGQTLVSSSEDKTIKVWNLNTGKLLHTLAEHSDTVRSLSISADGQTLASGGADKKIKLWNLQTGQQKGVLGGHSAPIWSVAISRDGQTLISGGEDRSINIWNLRTGKLQNIRSRHSDRIFSIALSPNEQTFASGSKDKTIKIWHPQTGKLLRTLEGHSSAVRTIAYSPNGQKLASGSWDKTIKIWNPETGKVLHTFQGHSDRVVSVAFNRDGQTLVSGSIDKNVKIWDIETGKVLRNLSGHSDWVLSVATSPSGQTLVSSSKDKTIKIWQQ